MPNSTDTRRVARMVGRRYVLSVCMPFPDLLVPGCQGLGGNGKGRSPV
jgi:hypothetical protein